MFKKCKCMHLSAISFGVSLGIVSGLFMLLFSIAAMQWGFGTEMMHEYSSMLPGVEASVKGSLIAFCWGFLEGLIIGLVWAWIYNICLCCYRCCCCCCKTTDVSRQI